MIRPEAVFNRSEISLDSVDFPSPFLPKSAMRSSWSIRNSNFDKISGISFLPYTDHVYKQAPYQDVTKDEYLELKKKMPSTIDFSLLKNYESEDNTTGSQELACTGGVCELVDVSAPQED